MTKNLDQFNSDIEISEEVDFSKKKLLRDALGGIIPQYYDARDGVFKPITIDLLMGGNGGNPGDPVIPGDGDDDVIIEPVIYGVKIDTSNPDPESAVTYTDDSASFTPSKGNNGLVDYGSWEDKFPFNLMKPCLLKNGEVNYYLDKKNYTKKSNGQPSDITTGNDGDVMVEFPPVYWKFEKVGKDLYIRISNIKVDDGYKNLAHVSGDKELSKIYLAAYLGYREGSKLRSLSGKMPTAQLSIGEFREAAHLNGDGYEQALYYQIMMLQVFSLIMFKSRDGQKALGRGRVYDNYDYKQTGTADEKGMFYGENSGKYQIKFCGIEDFWGNFNIWLDGICTGSLWHLLTSTENFNDTGEGYFDHGRVAGTMNYGSIDNILGTTETGFILSSGRGTETTHYADYGFLDANSVTLFGGGKTDNFRAGPFSVSIGSDPTSTHASTTARLSFLKS